MHGTELTLLALMLATTGLSILASRVGQPYPILLVLGGLLLGLLPWVPSVELPPELVLVLFLPPLLYSSAFIASPRDLKADLRAISTLAVGLVLVTVVAVAVAAHMAIDGLPWAAAFALGAIVSPTDPLAATTIASRLGAPRRLVTILEGESLINDATALVAYRIAIAAAVGGSFELWQAGLRFVVGVVGGVAIGLAVGWLAAFIRRRIDDPPVEIIVSLVTGYAAYLPAERLGVSAVLAAVTAGLYVGWRAPSLAGSATRLVGYSFWKVLDFVVNATLFMLVGLQLQPILAQVSGRPIADLVLSVLLVTVVVVGVRMAWEFTVPYLVRLLDRRRSQVLRRVGARDRLVLGWSGLRGAVSLAAALAIPLTGPDGKAFPFRDLILFVTFGVIFLTLVGQGLSLPWLIRRLGVHDDGGDEREELLARRHATDAALARIDELAAEDWTRDDTIGRLRAAYDYRRRRLSARGGDGPDDGYEERSLAYQRLVRELLDAQRRAIVGLRDQGAISSAVMRRVERDLDLEDSRLEI